MHRKHIMALLSACWLFFVVTAEAAGWTPAERASRLKQLATDMQHARSLPAYPVIEACFKQGQRGNERAVRAGLIVTHSALIAQEMAEQAAVAAAEGPAAAVAQRRAFLATPRGQGALRLLAQFNEANQFCTEFVRP